MRIPQFFQAKDLSRQTLAIDGLTVNLQKHIIFFNKHGSLGAPDEFGASRRAPWDDLDYTNAAGAVVFCINADKVLLPPPPFFS